MEVLGKYFSMRIIDMALNYVDVVKRYPDCKKYLDMHLKEEDREDLIVNIEGLQ